MIDALTEIPATRFDGVFVAPERLGEAERWLADSKETVLESTGLEESEQE
jgi:hypothetical protein